ncbi:MAG TPA: YqhV family protein [Limnochordales bacterium]
MGDDAGLVRAMAVVRIISSAIELTAALLMLRLGRLDAAVQINAALGMVGPLVLVTVTLLGVVGLAGKIPLARLALLSLGVMLVILGARR